MVQLETMLGHERNSLGASAKAPPLHYIMLQHATLRSQSSLPSSIILHSSVIIFSVTNSQIDLSANLGITMSHNYSEVSVPRTSSSIVRMMLPGRDEEFDLNFLYKANVTSRELFFGTGLRCFGRVKGRRCKRLPSADNRDHISIIKLELLANIRAPVVFLDSSESLLAELAERTLCGASHRDKKDLVATIWLSIVVQWLVEVRQLSA